MLMAPLCVGSIYKSLTESEVQVELPVNPPPPLSGWVTVKEDNYQSVAPSIPPVTSGWKFTVNSCVKHL